MPLSLAPSNDKDHAMTVEETKQTERELSSEELKEVVGGVTAAAQRVPRPTEYLTINLENTMVSG